MGLAEVSEYSREVVYVHTGQCGVQMGSAVWELMCVEHGIKMDGKSELDFTDYEEVKPTCIYAPTEKGTYVPRSLMIDSEPTVIDEIRTGLYRNLFGPQFLINGIEDAANNFARGRRTVTEQLAPLSLRRIREQIENCNNLQSFFFVYGVGGGTGGGFSSALMQKLQDEYSKKDIHVFCVAPGRALSTIVVEPYNLCMAYFGLVDYSNSVVGVDNESLYSISTKMLQNDHPTYSNINRLLGQVFSDLTCNYRYQNWVGNDLNQIQTNIIPYPRLHFLSASYAPLHSRSSGDHATNTVFQLTKSVFKAEHQLTEVNLQYGKFMACSLQYRGLVGPSEVNAAIQSIKRMKLCDFVDWCPTGFKVGICSRTPARTQGSLLWNNVNRTVLLVANSTSLGMNWRRMLRKYDVLYNKRAFMHWYVMEGMEESEFEEVKDEVNALVNDYKMIESTEHTDGDNAKGGNPVEPAESDSNVMKLDEHFRSEDDDNEQIGQSNFSNQTDGTENYDGSAKFLKTS